MPEEEVPELAFTLEERIALIRSKTETFKKLLEEKKRVLDSFNAGATDAEMDAWSKRYDQVLENIQKLTKDLADELTELGSFRRGQRFTEWPAWWNLWVGGLLAAFVVNFFDMLWELLQVLLRNLNNPEKVLEIALKVIELYGKKGF